MAMRCGSFVAFAFLALIIGTYSCTDCGLQCPKLRGIRDGVALDVRLVESYGETGEWMYDPAQVMGVGGLPTCDMLDITVGQVVSLEVEQEFLECNSYRAELASPLIGLQTSSVVGSDYLPGATSIPDNVMVSYGSVNYGDDCTGRWSLSVWFTRSEPFAENSPDELPAVLILRGFKADDTAVEACRERAGVTDTAESEFECGDAWVGETLSIE